jgi:hypothetical protein
MAFATSTARDGPRWMATLKSPLVAIFAGLVVGIVLAVGHHFYYHWLNGQIVETSTQQQWALQYVYISTTCESELH